MENERDDDSLPVSTYPTIMMRVDEKITNTLNGYNQKNVLTEIKKH